ncbi:hypothetical protein JB92DRAFT_3114521 [Gautieria morchelliformis]|nr:hypothetical protein JB92DRAFT_3114521 [Gautieria morchelliformis]
MNDNYRPVVFCDTGSVKLPSQSPQSQNPACAGRDEHLGASIFADVSRSHVFGGDISDDYGHHFIVNAMEELRAAGDEAPVVHADNDRWNSGIGKEIWEQVMSDRLYWASRSYEEGFSHSKLPTNTIQPTATHHALRHSPNPPLGAAGFAGF